MINTKSKDMTMLLQTLINTAYYNVSNGPLISSWICEYQHVVFQVQILLAILLYLKTFFKNICSWYNTIEYILICFYWFPPYKHYFLFFLLIYYNIQYTNVTVLRYTCFLISNIFLSVYQSLFFSESLWFFINS